MCCLCVLVFQQQLLKAPSPMPQSYRPPNTNGPPSAAAAAAAGNNINGPRPFQPPAAQAAAQAAAGAPRPGQQQVLQSGPRAPVMTTARPVPPGGGGMGPPGGGGQGGPLVGHAVGGGMPQRPQVAHGPSSSFVRSPAAAVVPNQRPSLSGPGMMPPARPLGR